jgi:NAD(P)-dependent dehydrogenase (short-subunit alcohol dehydrogenase family)
MGDMRGRTALVTGGAHGIGRAVVQKLLAAGARVIVLDPELPGELDADTPGLTLVAGDVRRREDVRRAADGVDAVVAVAGIGALTPLLEIDDATWQRMLDVNLTGVFLTVQEGARAMVDAGRRGAIAVVSSTNAIFAEESTVPYTTTKGALVALVRAASLDLARHGIRINAVAPGMVRGRRGGVPAPRPARALRRTGGDRVRGQLPPHRGIQLRHRLARRGGRGAHRRDEARRGHDRRRRLNRLAANC